MWLAGQSQQLNTKDNSYRLLELRGIFIFKNPVCYGRIYDWHDIPELHHEHVSYSRTGFFRSGSHSFWVSLFGCYCSQSKDFLNNKTICYVACVLSSVRGTWKWECRATQFGVLRDLFPQEMRRLVNKNKEIKRERNKIAPRYGGGSLL